MQKTTRQWLGLGMLWAALVSSTSFAEDLFPPCWRTAAGTTYQNWSLDASNNPALPEIFSNPNGVPEAAFVLGPFSKGWRNQLFGGRQGGWDLGQNGSMTLAVPNQGGSADSWKYLVLQVTCFSGIYEPPAVSAPGASLLTSSATIVQVVTGIGNWSVRQSVWLLQPGVSAETVLITATANGALIDQVVLDTIVLEPLCPGSQTLNADAGQCSKANVNFGFAYPDGCVLDIICSHPDGSTFPVGVTPVTCAVTDFAGRSTNCSFTITVLDTQPPVLTCPPNITRTVDPGYCSALVNLAPPVQENCPGLVLRYYLGATEITSPHIFPVGTATVRVVATDAAGLTAECTFEVTVTTGSQSGDAFAPCWRGQAGSTFQDWQFSADATNAVAPEVVSNPYGAPTAAIHPGLYTSGWYDQTYPFGCKAGFWDLGRHGTISLDIPNNNSCGSCYKYIRVQVAQFLGAGVYTELATIGISGATQLGTSRQVVVESIPDWGDWVVDESVWAVASCPASETVVVTAAYNGSLVDEVIVDTLCMQVDCPSDLTLSADPGQCSKAGVTWPLPPIDGCLIKGINCSPALGSTFPVGSTPVTCVVQDAESTRSCQFNVVVRDEEAPLARTKNITVPLDGTGHATITPTEIDDGSTDNCAIVDRSLDQSSFDCANKGPNTVVLTVRDAAGHENSAAATVTVVDTLPPSVVCPGHITQPSDPGWCSALVMFAATAADNCPGVTLRYYLGGTEITSSHVFPVGTATVRVVATDAAGLTAECTFEVTVTTGSQSGDAFAPCWRGQAGSTFQDWQFSADATNAVAPEVVSNPYGAPTAAIHPGLYTSGWYDQTYPFGCKAGFWDLGRYGTISLDIPNNNSCGSCYKYIRVQVTQFLGAGVYTELATIGISGATQLGTSRQVVVESIPDWGDWVVDESVWAVASCPASETVVVTAAYNGSLVDEVIVDTLCMQVDCPSDLTLSADPGQCSKAGVTWPLPPIDGCLIKGINCSPALGSTFAVGTTPVNCVVQDAESTRSCEFNVVVRDDQPPSLACPGGLVTNTTTECSQVVNFEAIGTDNCSATVSCAPPSGSVFLKGNTIVNCTVVDGSGNTASCSFPVTVNDTTLPVLACADIVTNTTGLCNQRVIYAPVAADNCAVTNSWCLPPSGTRFQVGTNTVICKAVDSSGNTNSCNFKVIVLDLAPPVITCSADIVTNVLSGCSQIVNFTASATDNCSITNLACIPPAGSSFAVGTTPVTCVAADRSGNTSSCTFTVTVLETVPPVIACPANIVTNTTASCEQVVNFAATATDNCGITNLSCTPPSGASFPVGSTPVTCVATDSSGNSSACTFSVSVMDTIAPVITCPANIVTNTTGGCDQVVSFAPTATDNCGVASVSCEPASGAEFPNGTTTVTCAATDAAGNTASCSFTVTVNDTEAPSMACPGNIVTNTTTECSQVVNFEATGVDNCSEVTISCAPPSGSAFPKGQTIVTCTGTDASGNSASCSFGVTVNDTTLPLLACPNIVTNTTGLCNQQVFFAGTDNCGVTNFSCLPPSGTRFQVGTNTVICKAVDSSGNSNSCTFKVIVLDLAPPVIHCSADIVTNVLSGCSQIVNFVVTATDNCSITNLACMPPSGSSFMVGTTPVTCVAADRSGNTSSCTFTVTVRETVPPVIACPPNILTNTTASCEQVVNFAATATDNCGPAGVVCNPASGTIFPVGNTTVACTATDISGNEAQCSFTVRVEQAPVPLGYQRQGDNLIITWPLACHAFILEQATYLNPPTTDWVPAEGVLEIVGDVYQFTTPITGPMRFFRLRQP